MKLKHVEIVNFRSIQKAEISFKPKCRVLVGINESGKSNILKALSLIGDEYNPTDKDVREPRKKEKPIAEARVRFVFNLEDREIGSIFSTLSARTLVKNNEEPLILNSDKKYSLKEFCKERSEGIYTIDILDKTKTSSYWSIGNEFKVSDGWRKPSEVCPSDFLINVNGKEVTVKNFALIKAENFPEIPPENLEKIDAKYVNALIGSETLKIIKENLPSVIFWEYEEKDLLPSKIDIASFVANPDSCPALKNMFTLAGVDPATDIVKARNLSSNAFRNLLERVATQTTDHFRSVWKEYKEISFALEPNGDTIEPNIVEENHWQMEQRSDGIKRFLTFLLHISVNVKANVLSETLLLIDEPDTGLHPAGSRFLRDELIQIGKKNYVVFSTHSIFMIDKDEIGRHLIVKKENEKTGIISADKSNFVDEEVLYNALSFSVFDIIKLDNLIFEGWRDKKLFQVATEKIPERFSADLVSLKEKLKTLGLCHAEGVKDVRNITPVLQLAGRNCVILSDSDKPAKEKQAQYKKIHGYGDWKRYDEVQLGITQETAEDFFTQAYFDSTLKKVLDRFLAKDHARPATFNVKRIEKLKAWLLANGFSDKDTAEKLNDLKTELFEKISVDSIDDSYFEFLKGLQSYFASSSVTSGV